MKISSWRLQEPSKKKLKVQFREGKLSIRQGRSSSAGWQMMSLVKISEFKNGEEKKRNPRKETELYAISGNEEERTYVNFPH